MSVTSDLVTRLVEEGRQDFIAGVRTATARYDRMRERLPELELDLAKMAEAGVLTDEVASQLGVHSLSSEWSGSRDNITVDRESLPLWRRIGRLVSIGKDFSHRDNDSGKDFIRVRLTVEGLERVRIQYVRELPSGSRCHVEEHVSSYRSLTCSLS